MVSLGYIVHMPQVNTLAPWTPWDNQSFGLLGEIVHGMVSTISFPENAFKVVMAWVKNPDYMIQNLQEIQEIPVFPPNLPDPDDGEVSEVTTHRYMFLPHAYYKGRSWSLVQH
jgi:hypothetical protein